MDKKPPDKPILPEICVASVYERDIKGVFGHLKMAEISYGDLRGLCDKIVDRAHCNSNSRHKSSYAGI
ncbi:hypothetical protein [Nitrosomonas communis]|uniref:Uncharacterized protein n=1 Tax=Nitrosomonas communis TaxID=44574 RepID=A0A1I4T9G6_9PROT|nr:hypothetical protein [Nitrosomonas communis]SFM73359.1 hypothetical protein SAMN05421863_104819 [Nitrosomonas communis]